MAVLIVDDHAPTRRLLRELLLTAAPRRPVMEADSASAALELCRRCRPGIVLLDVGLPDANGIALTGAIRTLLPGAEVIIVSGHSSRAHVEHARAAGVFAYIVKDTVHRALLPAVTAAWHASRSAAGPAAS